jgi:hypothetical protein
MSNVLNNMMGNRHEAHELAEKKLKKLHSDKCSCDRCKMHTDKYSHADIVYVAGTPVSLNRP